jgi:hypothetical protein
MNSTDFHAVLIQCGQYRKIKAMLQTYVRHLSNTSCIDSHIKIYSANVILLSSEIPSFHAHVVGVGEKLEWSEVKK